MLESQVMPVSRTRNSERLFHHLFYHTSSGNILTTTFLRGWAMRQRNKGVTYLSLRPSRADDIRSEINAVGVALFPPYRYLSNTYLSLRQIRSFKTLHMNKAFPIRYRFHIRPGSWISRYSHSMPISLIHKGARGIRPE